MRVSARIIKHTDAGSHSYITSQLFRKTGALDFYSPGAGATSVDQAEHKMKKFEEAVNNGAVYEM